MAPARSLWTVKRFGACIYKASRIDGKQVETIEGVARDGVLHPLQQAFIEAGAVQCGFCTPGMIMAAKALLDKKTDPDDDDIRAAMKHNLCRCTGYSKILEAVHIAAGTAAKSDSRSQHAGSHIVGNGLPRTEATGRATGAEQYTADLQIPGMLAGAGAAGGVSACPTAGSRRNRRPPPARRRGSADSGRCARRKKPRRARARLARPGL